MKTVDHSYEQALIMHDNVHIHVIMNIIMTPIINDDCNGLIALAMKAIKNQVILDQLKSGISRRRVGLLSKGPFSKNNQNIERWSFFYTFFIIKTLPQSP